MAVVLTPPFANPILNYLLGQGVPPAIAAVYLDLYNGNPQGGGASVLAAITGSAVRPSAVPYFGSAAGGAVANLSTITFTGPDGAIGPAPVTHVAFFDAATSGNLVMSQALVTARTVVFGATVQFVTSDLILTLS